MFSVIGGILLKPMKKLLGGVVDLASVILKGVIPLIADPLEWGSTVSRFVVMSSVVCSLLF